jgi:N-acetylneuraminate synthase
MSVKLENLFIFELANNHQGSIAHARYIIEKCAEVATKFNLNAAVKFQYRDLDTFIHPDYKKRTDVKHIPRFLSTRLGKEDFYSLVRYTKDLGLIAMCTPFDEASVDLCADHGIDIIKVASCSSTDWWLLEKIAEVKKPVIISTGGQPIAQVDNIYNFFFHRSMNFALLHCVGIYPPQSEQMQLNCIERMIDRYPDILIGYSGHEDPHNFLISQMAVAKGATILERHIGHKAEGGVSLNAYSTEADELSDWIMAIKTAQEMLGNKRIKRVFREEQKSLAELERGAFVKRNIVTGEELSRENVYFAMPSAQGQTTASKFKAGITATRDYKANEPLYEQYAPSVTQDMHSILHDVKGMLYEAKIVLRSEFELELSHHYGMEHFRHYGATIINIVNREYCKKIIVVLPGQIHPSHCHKAKEETFQVLYGNLHLTLNGEKVVVETGKIFTVGRDVMHAFEAPDGCIFEEISTTHVKGDSFYEDPSIAELDINTRKTVLTNW